MNSGISFSGWWYGPNVFEPRVTTRVDAVGHDVAPDEQLAGGLRGRVGRARARAHPSRPTRPVSTEP